MKELITEEIKGNTLNSYLTKCLNAIFEVSNIDELEEITSLNYDGVNKRLVIGVNAGFWVLSEDSKGLRGVYYGE